ncbi:MAG: hypothetical protein LBM67_01225, partial [Lentimicrobiaceae bacterium]|nr:hypothetical protein [Lentimicrobiaceae bacterium]
MSLRNEKSSEIFFLYINRLRLISKKSLIFFHAYVVRYKKVLTFADPNRVELEAAMGVEKGKK